MQENVRLERGHIDFLIQALDGESEGVEPPRLPPLSKGVAPEVEHSALGFLLKLDLPIEPRKQWATPGGSKCYEVQGAIPADHPAETGMALCRWGDGGWGQWVRAGKLQDGRFADELVDASASLVRRWRPTPKPLWVKCIPSLRNPHLVTDFARRLADVLKLPFRIFLKQTNPRDEQKSMANSAQQARNVDGSLAICRSPRPTPVLLVDDVVGSRWTFAVAAWLLRKHGSAAVWPFALSTLGRSQ